MGREIYDFKKIWEYQTFSEYRDSNETYHSKLLVEQTYQKVKNFYGGYYDDIQPQNYEYFLDFIEGSDGGVQSLSQFNVQNIGRRTKIVTNNDTTCVFPTEIPNFIIIEADGDVEDDIALCAAKGQECVQVSSEIFKNISMGSVQNSAYDKVKELLYTHTSYNETVSLTTIPIYHLEPNTRISVEDSETGVHGKYLIKSISIPLGQGDSTISCTKCIDKIEL